MVGPSPLGCRADEEPATIEDATEAAAVGVRDLDLEATDRASARLTLERLCCAEPLPDAFDRIESADTDARLMVWSISEGVPRNEPLGRDMTDPLRTDGDFWPSTAAALACTFVSAVPLRNPCVAERRAALRFRTAALMWMGPASRSPSTRSPGAEPTARTGLPLLGPIEGRCTTADGRTTAA